MVAADKTDDASDFLNEIPRLVDDLLVLTIEAHLNKDVARIELTNLRGFLTVLTSETTSVGKRTSKMESSSSSAFLNFSM